MKNAQKGQRAIVMYDVNFQKILTVAKMNVSMN